MLKKLYPILILVALLFPVYLYAQSQPTQTPSKLSEGIINTYIPFSGLWLPDMEPSEIGPGNFKTLQNYRYRGIPPNTGIEGINGYGPINTTAVTGFPDFQNGFQFKKDQPQESHVMVWGLTAGATATGVYKNDTTIPLQGQFTGVTVVHTDASGVSLGQFSKTPDGGMAYANGKESLIWYGDEMRVAAFITSDAAVTDAATNPINYTVQANNKLTDSDNVIFLGGGDDNYAKLLLHFDDITPGVITDSSQSAHSAVTAVNVLPYADHKKFGVSGATFYFGLSGPSATSAYVGFNDNVDFDMSSSDYTVDFWLLPVSNTAGSFYLGQGTDSNNHFYLSVSNSQIDIVTNDGGSVKTVTFSFSTSLISDQWYHIAVVRPSGASEDVSIYLNGILGKAGDTHDWDDYNGALFIGGASETDFPNEPTYGSQYVIIDELRITKGLERWSANFNTPTRPYGSGQTTFAIASIARISGASFYIKNGNPVSGQTVTVQEHNGSSWSGVSIIGASVDPTNGLSQPGKITWASTVNTSKPKYLEGGLFYWYQFTLSDGETTITNVTLDAPMQPIVDLWDAVFRQPIAFQINKSGNYEDYTIAIREPSSDLNPIGATIGGVSGPPDHAIIMFEDRMQAIQLEMLSGNTVTMNSGTSLYYWNGSADVLANSLFDLTIDANQPLNKSGVVSWNPPDEAEEVKRTLFGRTGYAYKVFWNGILDSTGEISATLIDVVYGIPAPITVKPFKFPISYKNRLMLAAYTEGSEGNRIDYAMANTTTGWNGEDSSKDGIYSLYVGGNEELMGAKQIYNRYGSNVFTALMACKKSETYLIRGNAPSGDDAFQIFPVSDNLGCPAPLTIASAEIGHEIAPGIARNILMWLSYSRPAADVLSKDAIASLADCCSIPNCRLLSSASLSTVSLLSFSA